MRLLVTGHNGYIGSVMVPALQAAGHDVVGLDTFFFADCTLGADAGWVPALNRDIRDVRESDLEGFDGVVHLAALCNDPLGDLYPEWTAEINHQASVRLGAPRARGRGAALPVRLLMQHVRGCGRGRRPHRGGPLRPLTAYATSRVRTEEDVSKLADGSFSPVFMRNATAYGLSPRLRADVVLNNLVCWAHTTGVRPDNERRLPLAAHRPYPGHCRSVRAALVAPRAAIHNQAFNVGATGENYQVRDTRRVVRSTVPGCTMSTPRARARTLAAIEWTSESSTARSWTTAPNGTHGSRGEGELYAALQEAGVTLEDSRAEGSFAWFSSNTYVRVDWSMSHFAGRRAGSSPPDEPLRSDGKGHVPVHRRPVSALSQYHG